jgi:Fe-S oxidoreductase
MFMKDQGFRSFPTIADKPFRDRFKEIKPMVHNPVHRVALFSGCVQDFVYPEQMEAAVKVMARHNVAIDFPMDQSCCGLPVQMMGEKQATIDVAKQNVDAFEGTNCDYIVTLCASCASHLKESYAELLAGDRKYKEKVKRFSAKIIDFSSYVHDVLGVSADDFNKSNEKVAYHASCHLCRELKVVEQPRNLIEMAGDYAPSAEEDVCCGFGGTFTVKFPELSSTLLDKKLTNIEATGAKRLVADCPGCLLHLRGGSNVRKNDMKVTHIAELLAENLK